MKNKNVIIASAVVSLVVLFSGIAYSEQYAGNDEVAKVPTVSAGVPLTVELPFLYSQNQTVTDNVMKQQLLTSNVQKVGVEILTPKATPNEEVIQEESFKPYDIPLSADLQKYISDLCDSYNISFELVLALAKVESDYNAKLISPTNDYGLYQINRINHADLKKALKKEYDIDWDWKNPYHNALAGIYHINSVRDAWKGSGISEEQLTPYVLLSYNMGVSNANKYLKNHNPNDWAYVRKVMKYKNMLEKGESIAGE